MKAVLTLSVAVLSLSGCSYLFPEDSRIGEEALDACLARVASERRDTVFDSIDDGALWVPTYTYDVTKLDLDSIKEPSISGHDETEGTRITLTTNETSTAVDQFMQQSVDEDGAFFMGRDPALYRVRGEALPLDEIISAGCKRQRANMRLIKVDFARHDTAPAEPANENSEDTSPEKETTD